MTWKIDFESQILALFDTSSKEHFSKFNNFLWVCWFLGKYISNFVPLPWKLYNLYHNIDDASPQQGLTEKQNDIKPEYTDILCVDYNGSIKTISVTVSSLTGDPLDLLREANQLVKSDVTDFSENQIIDFSENQYHEETEISENQYQKETDISENLYQEETDVGENQYQKETDVCENQYQSESRSSDSKSKTEIVVKKPFQCSMCKIRFKQETSLKTHIACVHEGKKFINKSVDEGKKLKKGSENSFLEKPFPCLLCDKRYSHKKKLNYHSRIVHEEKKLSKCEICKKKVFDMNRHVAMVHEKKKSYKCEYCEKSFSRNYSLNLHNDTVHEGKKPFGCNYCNTSFSQKSALEKHLKG